MALGKIGEGVDLAAPPGGSVGLPWGGYWTPNPLPGRQGLCFFQTLCPIVGGAVVQGGAVDPSHGRRWVVGAVDCPSLGQGAVNDPARETSNLVPASSVSCAHHDWAVPVGVHDLLVGEIPRILPKRSTRPLRATRTAICRVENAGAPPWGKSLYALPVMCEPFRTTQPEPVPRRVPR